MLYPLISFSDLWTVLLLLDSEILSIAGWGCAVRAAVRLNKMQLFCYFIR